MRIETIERKIYTFDELSEKAKQKVIDWLSEDVPWQAENQASCEAIARALDVQLQTDSYDGITVNVELYTGCIDDDILELSGIRALKYVWNNYIWPNMQGKYYGKLVNGEHVKRYSKATKVFDCPFTGHYMDRTLYEAWQEFSRKPSTVAYFIKLVADRLAKEWTANNEYHVSEECISETCAANGYEFTESGKIV